VMIQITQQY